MQTQSLQPTELDTLKDKIKDIRIAFMTTVEPSGELHSRPMATHGIDPDGTMWFFTHDDSHKNEEVQRDHRVSLTFADPGSDTYVATSGMAEIVKDRQKVDELWSDFLKTWFPGGKDDPGISLLKVTTHRAEYWDRPGGKIVTLFEMVKGALTGQPDTTARNEKLGTETV